ncbi:MAG: hypothetical protein KAI26_04190 [Nanoarchaeota archaeon]|nr:hypothetical protein [Nanoarchaeota archaeon]
MSRFDYIKYDERSIEDQKLAKEACVRLELLIGRLNKGRATSLAITNLEQCYMWIGKQIRDEQIARDGDSEDQPQRG